MITAPESLQNTERSGTAPRFRRLLAVAAVVSAGSVVGLSAVGSASADDDTCTVDGPVTADGAERGIQTCLTTFEAAYTACMLDAPGTADSLERWVDHCRAEAG